MSVSWRGFTAGDWNLQLFPEVRDRVYVMNCIAATKQTKVKTYHASILLNSIEYCPFAKRDKIAVPESVVDVCRELIYHSRDFWNNGAEERNG